MRTLILKEKKEIIFVKELKVSAVYFSSACFDIKSNLPVNKVYKY